jgi:AraC family transcriptional activator of pobA
MKHFKSLSELHRANGLPPPENPLISLFRCGNSCSITEMEFTSDFYMIGFKKMRSGVILYGKTKYDHDNGSMMFVKPRQTIQFRDLELEEDGFLIFIHEDYFNGHPLHGEIRKYGYFEYDVNEALHLSPKEEQTIRELYHKIAAEHANNQDEYSRDITLSHIDSILRYAQRFYKRQFINRSTASGRMDGKFQKVLAAYLESGALQEQGLPTVSHLASRLYISPKYLSDQLKSETGKTALELIHISLISEAKNLLKGDGQTVSEVAYTLGFENLPYFSRLFKKEVGLTPKEFKKQHLN